MAKKYKLDETQVSSLRDKGLTYSEIASILNVPTKTVRNYFGLSYRRAYTHRCELCGCTEGWLCYHHWDNEEPECGLWLCYRCHGFARAIDSFGGVDMKARYLEIKQGAIEEVHSRQPRKLLDVEGSDSD